MRYSCPPNFPFASHVSLNSIRGVGMMFTGPFSNPAALDPGVGLLSSSEWQEKVRQMLHFHQHWPGAEKLSTCH
jgi:hypothetical protein